MTFDEIWNQLTRKRPELEKDDGVLEFKALALKCLLRQVFEQGQGNSPISRSSLFDDIFSS